MPNKQLTLEQYAAETTEQTTARVIAEVFAQKFKPTAAATPEPIPQTVKLCVTPEQTTVIHEKIRKSAWKDYLQEKAVVLRCQGRPQA